MHLAYRLIVASLAFAGSVSLVVSGELNPAFVAPGLAMLPGYYRYIRGLAPASRWSIAGLALVELFVVAADALFISGDFFIAVAHMTIVFQALKSFDMREPWDPLQVYFMSLLQLVIASELTLSIAMGAVFVVFLCVFMAAMVFSHFMKEGTLRTVRFARPLVFISLLALLATVVFFISVPRVGAGVLGRRTSSAVKSVGFTENVDLGSFGRALRDESIVMRVELEGRRLPLYWRGMTLDRFDGHAWKDTDRARLFAARKGNRAFLDNSGRPRRPERENIAVQKIINEPLDTDVVFGLGEIVEVETDAWKVERDRSGAVFIPSRTFRRFSLTARSVPEGGRPVEDTGKYLQLPEGMDRALERIAALARQATRGRETELSRALAIEKFLMENFEYSLETTPPRDGAGPVEHFLFTEKKGFCEHYATAMALMLRTVGIPARLVTGFKGGDENAPGDYVVVRQSNAHSWVEAAIGGRWRRFDPTPGADGEDVSFFAFTIDALRMSWYRYVVGFSSRDQARIARSFSAPVLALPSVGGVKLSLRPLHVVLAAGAAWALIAVFVIGKPVLKRHSFETRAYLRFRKAVRRRGGRVGASSTAREVAREARRLNMDGGMAAHFVGLYEEARFGGRAMDASMRRKFLSLSGIRH